MKMDIITFTPFEKAFFEKTRHRFDSIYTIERIIDDHSPYPGQLTPSSLSLWLLYYHTNKLSKHHYYCEGYDCILCKKKIVDHLIIHLSVDRMSGKYHPSCEL